MTCTVITATIGRPELLRAAESVADQTVPCTHLVIADGPVAAEAARKVLRHGPPVTTLALPWNTGAVGGYCYAVGCLLVQSDYVCFLDDDNWYEPYHVEDMVGAICSYDLDFGAAARLYWREDMREVGFMPEDVGGHIDTSCYCLKNHVAKQVAMAWTQDDYYHDRTVARVISGIGLKGRRSPLYTVNYTLPEGRRIGGRNE